MREIDLAIVGDIAWNKDITPQGQRTSPGGAAYYSAAGASHFSEKVGVVGRIGEDFDLSLLQKRHIDVEGVIVVPEEETCRFVLKSAQTVTEGKTKATWLSCISRHGALLPFPQASTHACLLCVLP